MTKKDKATLLNILRELDKDEKKLLVISSAYSSVLLLLAAANLYYSIKEKIAILNPSFLASLGGAGIGISVISVVLSAKKEEYKEKNR